MNKFFSNFKKQKQDSSLTSFTEEKSTNKKTSNLFMRLSLKDRITFIKQLSILMRAGVPLFSSLNMLKKHSRSRTMHKIMDSVIRDVENGQYLATALGKFKKIFGNLTINIIAVGEVSGTLTDNLDHLVLTLKKNQALNRKVVSASVYPIFIIISTLIITVMLTVFFFPKIIPVFKSVNYDLPFTTKMLIFISDFMRSNGLLSIATVIILAIGIVLLLRNKKIHFWFDKTLLYIPLFNRMIQGYNTTNICRTLGLLLNGGVTVVRSIQITSETTNNLVYKAELTRIADKIMRGEKISSQLENNKRLFPEMVSQMIEVGESTGKLSDTFLYLADIYEEEMDDLTKNLSTTVEPLLLVFMGILVGFIAISIITPIYGITQHLNPR